MIWRWLATRAASGWIAAAGIAGAGALWFAWDHRGDQIADLTIELQDCRGSAKQAGQIKRLVERVQEQAQKEANSQIEKLDRLPGEDCYLLDGPSPLDELLSNPTNKGN